ncbi:MULTISPECIES: DUF2470 domain-containing protein [unclassified Streptomyces]|uniref:DUF2470 domain-containing protein n=1 Tax=unclassified Streptomyces TaxID=2593676 RepID=UPI000DC7CC85|nr:MULTISPECIES: DUF2470 domain-containing protein [unclassified Streptomyces]AWZ07914.1 DUF2470 domain-containing protein [Streptomyces sp. ICC4]AWZ15037.1 DUF2470 domain-containing protein [Streptomyces sp. ICC1]
MHLPMPTDAERVRSILAAAHSMTVVTDGLRSEIRHLDGTDPLGRLHLHPAEPGARSEHRPAIRMEFTDIAPTPVRDRVRARVTLLGRLLTPYSDEGADSTCVEFGQAVLQTSDGTRSYVGLEELDAACPDPLAPYEAGMLTHLLDDHAELVNLLLRLVGPQPAHRSEPSGRADGRSGDRADQSALLRALPVAMDRYGITLRLEERRGDRDVRLPFPSPLDDVEQSGAQIQALFSAARRRSHRNTLPA